MVLLLKNTVDVGEVIARGDVVAANASVAALFSQVRDMVKSNALVAQKFQYETQQRARIDHA